MRRAIGQDEIDPCAPLRIRLDSRQAGPTRKGARSLSDGAPSRSTPTVPYAARAQKSIWTHSSSGAEGRSRRGRPRSSHRASPSGRMMRTLPNDLAKSVPRVFELRALEDLCNERASRLGARSWQRCEGAHHELVASVLVGMPLTAGLRGHVADHQVERAAERVRARPSKASSVRISA